ncbi:MAG: alpha-L-fucosidase, partial [Muribaculaceae bacterium]|nr:alpha-L-fucosidase [Muribaculaceae bacterium]
LLLHILDTESSHIFVPTKAKVKRAKEYATGKTVNYEKMADGVMLHLDKIPDEIDYIVELSI